MLDVVEQEGIVQNAKDVGAYLKKGLQGLMALHPTLVVDVRGLGLAIGVEMRDPLTGGPGTAQTALVMRHCRDGGVLVGSDGLHGHCVKVSE